MAKAIIIIATFDRGDVLHYTTVRNIRLSMKETDFKINYLSILSLTNICSDIGANFSS